MTIKNYDRQKAVDYAEKWALSKNPRYLSYSGIGGDCTNFISQCIYEGSGIMNYTDLYGWYYKNGNNKSPSWTGVKFLYNFLTSNNGVGPFGSETMVDYAEIGDIIQLGNIDGTFYHSLIVTRIEGKASPNTIAVASHSVDSLNRPLDSYDFAAVRFIHIEGVRWLS